MIKKRIYNICKKIILNVLHILNINIYFFRYNFQFSRKKYFTKFCLFLQHFIFEVNSE